MNYFQSPYKLILMITTVIGCFNMRIMTYSAQAASMTITGSQTYNDATASGTAVSGFQRRDEAANGTDGELILDAMMMPIPTTAEELTDDQGFAGQYDGATSFRADYTIHLDENNQLVSGMNNSFVTFTTTTYTARTYDQDTDMYEQMPDPMNPDNMIDKTTVLRSNFTTPRIEITKVQFINNDPMMGIESFMFLSTDWYRNEEPEARRLTDTGLSGTINLTTGTSSYLAKYIRNSTGSEYQYSVNGSTAAPFAPDDEGFGTPPLYAPFSVSIPEPSTIIGLGLLATLGIGTNLKRKKK